MFDVRAASIHHARTNSYRWQPLALQYGKRPVYIFSIFATMAIQIWAPYTRSNGQWIANKILQGFFGAPIESLCEISMTDVYFTHERGYYIVGLKPPTRLKCLPRSGYVRSLPGRLQLLRPHHLGLHRRRTRLGK